MFIIINYIEYSIVQFELTIIIDLYIYTRLHWLLSKLYSYYYNEHKNYCSKSIKVLQRIK